MDFFVIWIVLAGAILCLFPKRFREFSPRKGTKTERIIFYVLIGAVAIVTLGVTILFYALLPPYHPSLIYN